MITDREYSDWLRASAQRVVLVEAQSHDGAELITHYLANTGYLADPSSSVGSAEYRECVQADLQFRSTIDGDFGVGSLNVFNLGEFDGWLDHGWAGWPLRIWLGDKSWARDDFRLVFDGVSDGVSAPSVAQIQIAVRDKKKLYDVPVLSIREDGQADPLAMGMPFNCEPILINAATHRYKANSGYTISIAARDKGVPIPINDYGGGEFTLLAQPDGQITCDVQTDVATAAQMMRALQSIAMQSGDELDSFADLSPLGFYASDQTTVADAMDSIAQSVGAAWTVGRTGNLKLVRLANPELPVTPSIIFGVGPYGVGPYGGSGVPEYIALADDDIAQGSVQVTAVEQPRAYIRLGYSKNFTEQDDGDMAGIVTAADRLRYKLPYSIVETQNDVLGQFPLAEQPDAVETYYVNAVDAQAEADRRAALRSKVRKIYRISGFMGAFGAEVGDVVQITYPRYSLDGAAAIVVGVTEKIASGQVELEVWR